MPIKILGAGALLLQGLRYGSNVGSRVACGVTHFMKSSASRPHAIGRAVLCQGLLLLVLNFLAEASGPLRIPPLAHMLFAALAGAPVLGTVLAAAMAIAPLSSLCTEVGCAGTGGLSSANFIDGMGNVV